MTMSSDYQEFIKEKTIDKKKFWNEDSKFYYVPCLKVGFEVLQKRLKAGESLEDIMLEIE